MSATLEQKSNSLRLMPGDLVEVRSAAEILATLDEKGTLGNLPFMPEMLAFCGRQFRVSRNAFKTCVDDREMRRLDDTVFLETVRCDGASHGGCDRACLIFWKTEWLKTVGAEARKVAGTKPRVTKADLTCLAQQDGQFFCQSSEILNASQPLPWWDPQQYLRDLSLNRVSPFMFTRGFLIAVYNKVAAVLKLRSWGAVVGSARANGHKPLNLKPGEFVRVKPLAEIKTTLDSEGKHQNLLFGSPMTKFCGQVLQVRGRVENIVLEATTRQRRIKDTVVLEGATCDGLCHRLCPRQSYLFWRECWLERVNSN
jgi:hypothetical protein